MIAALFVETGGMRERFFRFTTRDPVYGCLLWMGSKNGKGYGQFSISVSKPRLAHRVAWAMANGAWPIGCLLHSCDNPSCVEVSHLREGTRAENNAEMYAKGRGRPGASQAAQTHCKHGHELAGGNLRRYNGRRVCRTCAREWMRRKRAAE